MGRKGNPSSTLPARPLTPQELEERDMLDSYWRRKVRQEKQAARAWLAKKPGLPKHLGDSGGGDN